MDAGAWSAGRDEGDIPLEESASSPAVTQAPAAGARQDTDPQRAVETTDFGVDQKLVLCPAVALSVRRWMYAATKRRGENLSEYRVGRLHRGPPRPNISSAQNRPSVIPSNPKGSATAWRVNRQSGCQLYGELSGANLVSQCPPCGHATGKFSQAVPEVMPSSRLSIGAV